MVVEKLVLQLEAQLADRDVTIELSDEATQWLIANGYDELMGARPMARVIQEHIKKALADEVLFGRLKAGGHVRVVVVKDETGNSKLRFEYPDGPVKPRPEKLPAPRQGQAPLLAAPQAARSAQWRRYPAASRLRPESAPCQTVRHGAAWLRPRSFSTTGAHASSRQTPIRASSLCGGTRLVLSR